MWQASVARCLPTPPNGCYTAGLRPSLSDGSRRESYWSTIVIGNCAFGPITAVPHRAKACCKAGNLTIPNFTAKHLYTFVYPVSAPQCSPQ